MRTANKQGGRLKPRLRTAQLYSKDTLELGENLRIGDSFSRLVILQHGRLFVYLLSDVLLRKFPLHTCGLHRLYVCEKNHMVFEYNMRSRGGLG